MPAPLIEFPDSEGLLIDYLAAALPTAGFNVPVRGQKPDTAESVVPYRTGGLPADQFRDRPTIGFDVRAGTKTRAVAILNKVIALVYQLEGSSLAGHAVAEVQTIRGVTNESGIANSDPVRYSCLLTITVAAN